MAAHSVPPRGLRDIRTHSGLRSGAGARAPAPGDLAGATRTLKEAISTFQLRLGARRAAMRPPPPRAWVFVPRPRFARHQGELLVEPVTEPEVEVFDERGSVAVLAELPGSQDDDVRIAIDGDSLAIWTEPSEPPGRQGRRYERELLLPFAVESEPRSRVFRNGILELELSRRRATSRADTQALASRQKRRDS